MATTGFVQSMRQVMVQYPHACRRNIWTVTLGYPQIVVSNDAHHSVPGEREHHAMKCGQYRNTEYIKGHSHEFV